MGMPSIMEAMCFPAFQRAAAAVATFEVRVRLLADSRPEGTPLQRAAISMDLTALIGMICDEYGAKDDDHNYLKAVALLRNKLFHLELSRVTGRIRPLADQLSEGGTWMVNVNNGSVNQVSQTSTETGRIYGWMWESAQSGAFNAVETAVEKATTILHTLRDKRIDEDLIADGFEPEP